MEGEISVCINHNTCDNSSKRGDNSIQASMETSNPGKQLVYFAGVYCESD